MNTDEHASESLVTYLIESALLKISHGTLESIVEILDTDYGCKLRDCYEHPEYLDKILTEFYGKSAKVITNHISQALTEYSEDKKIANFLKVVCKK